MHAKRSAGHKFFWESSDVLVNQINARTYVDNLQLSSAIVLSGNHYHKIKIMFRFMELQIPCSSIFYVHQRHYICPVVNDYYLGEQVYTHSFI